MTTKHSTNKTNSSDDFFKLKPLVAGIRVVIAGGLFVGSGMVKVNADPLPVPVIAGPTITDGSAARGNATMAINGTQQTITQTTKTAVIDWKSFNIDKGYGVKFVQPSATASALNNIHDANATQIMGTLSANGQVYLVNNNGIVFGKDSTVDANTLVASALNISDANFNNGIIRTFDNNPNTPTAALSGGAESNAVIEVQAGAKIHIGQKGTAILAAPTVNNSGSITADQNGQILLVASEDNVYLQPASSSSPFAGLLVEVAAGGKVNNNAGANVAVREGNVTLAGFAVNQSGRLSATTSVNTNGSIRLLAREKAIADPSTGALTASQTVRDAGLETEQAGSVTFGSGSTTSILADVNSGSAIDEQSQKKSTVEVNANKIDLQSGSTIEATSGLVNLTASNSVDMPGAQFTGTSGRIHLEEGAKIDVAGSTNTTVPMSRNEAAVSIQSFNLRNAPYQRGGVLQGKTVQVDVRNLPTIVDASSASASLSRGINERLSKGGTVNLVSGGDTVVNKGAVTNIAGGSVTYQGGVVNTTQLVNADTGRVVNISNADPNQKYSSIYGVYTKDNEKWGVKESFNILTPLNSGQYQAGYTDGADAGALNIQSPVTAWAGTVIAGAVTSINQRSTPAFGGSLTINQNDNGGSTNPESSFLSNQDVVIQKTLLEQDAIGINDSIDSVSPITLSTELFNGSGLSNFVIKTAGNVSVVEDANLSMPMLSSLSVDASTFNIAGSIYTPGGTLALNAVTSSDPSSGQINLLANSQLNVSGNWVNDFKDGNNTPLAIHAGKVNLTATQLNLDEGAKIKADGGAQLNVGADNVSAGRAGSIKFNANSILFNGDKVAQNALSAIGISQGGSLSVITNKINIGSSEADVDPDALNLGVSNGVLDLTANAGFNTISLESTIQDITLNANTKLSFLDKNRLLNTNFRQQSGSKSLKDLGQLTTLPENARAPISLTLTGQTGVTMAKDSQIHMEKGSTVTINAKNTGPGIYINGLINAPAGTINLNLTADAGGEYNPNQAIWIDSLASLNAQGTTLLNPIDALGRKTGSVLDGGTVNVVANRGYAIFAEGSSINVNGANAKLVIPTLNTLQTTYKVIGSNAGQINIKAAEGIILDGNLSAKKGLATNAGGSLNVILDRSARNESGIFPINELHIDVQQQDTALLPNTSSFGDEIADSFNGQAVLSSQKIQQAGIDNLTLNVPYQINQSRAGSVRLLGDVNVSIPSSIILDAQKLSWASNDSLSNAAAINTGYLALGSSTLDITDVNDIAEIGDGALTANARNIELKGSSVLTGFSEVNLNAKHDMRTVGVNFDPTTKAYIGSLTTAGNLNLQASQLYPSTLTKFTFNVTDPSSQLTLSGQNTDVTPLSAAGSLSFNAPTINQNGVIKAPSGNITFNAADSLLFNADSYTSVSTEGQLIPFGTLLNNVWMYSFAGGNNLVFNSAPDNNSLGVKQISFNSPNIQFNKGSVVNVSGGGDLMTATFQPGPGGDYDYLMPGSASYNGGFAIMPSLGVSTLAPYDPNLSAGFANDPRAQVFLSASSNLAAGFYTMLPSYYALLPGTFLVTPQGNTLDQFMTTTTVSGLPIVSGYQTIAGTNYQPSLNSGYLIESSDVVQKNSQYNIETANKFYTNQSIVNHVSLPLLPEDSGQISINASTQLVLEGQFKVATSNGNGRGAKMDISAQNINVINADSSNATLGLQLLAQDLNNLKVDSLLLGGTRTIDNATGKTNLLVSADNVSFDEGVSIQALDLMAAGNQRVHVSSGASINATGQVNTGVSDIVLKGDGAFLRVSADKQINLNRQVDPDATNPVGTNGDLLIDADSTLTSTKSMLLAGSHSTSLNGNINMSGGSINMEANAINLGDVSALTADALNLTNQNLSNLKGNDVTLTSLSSINFYGDVGQLDADNILTPIQFNHLVLDAKSLSGFEGTALSSNPINSVMIKANIIDLQNTSGNASTPAGTGTGTLNLNTAQLNVTKGEIAIDGFTTADFNVDKQFSATGNSVLHLATDLNLTAGLINTTGGHSLLLDASTGAGYNVMINGHANNTLPVFNELGGRIGVSANTITLQDVNLLMPSGRLELNAIGDIAVNGKSTINLAGQTVKFADLVSDTPGGFFSANSSNGSVALGIDASLDISAGGDNASGGSLILKAPQNTVNVDGSLKATGANANIDLSSFSSTQGFDSLMNKLMTSGVNQAIYLRSRVTDIVQAAGDVITAKAISLVADSGSIDISGKLSTDSLDKAGNIYLFAAKDITLEKGSLLSATGSTGGHVSLSTLGTNALPGGIITLLPESQINVAGNSGIGGNVTLNAMRNTEANSGINIAPINGTVTGANQFDAVGFQKYDTSLVSSLPSYPMIDDVITGLSSSIPLNITNYLATVSTITTDDTDNLSKIITTDITNYLANASSITGDDIPSLSSIITQNVNNYMTAKTGAMTNADIDKLSSTIETDMSALMTSYSTDIKSLSNTINTDLNSYMANANAIESTLGHGVALRHGVEINNVSGPMTLATEWDFSTLSAASTPILGELIVRSAGPLNINASLKDGYLNNGSTLMNTNSWSFQLVSGADLSSADTMATTSLSVADKLNSQETSDLTIGSGSSLHTGTGDIKLASGGNLILTDQTASIYTGGRATVYDNKDMNTSPTGTLDNVTLGTGSLADQTLASIITGDYPIAGGNVDIRASGDIKGAVSNQFIRSTFDGASWLGVQGRPFDSDNKNNNLLTTWAVNASLFEQNIGSFGGGGVTVSALGNINDLSVMMPTTGKQLGTDYATSALDVQGGGQMSVVAGGNIAGGAYFLGQGIGTISAGGQISGSYSTESNAFVSGPQLVMSGNQRHPLTGNTHLTLNANQGIKITGVSDAMVLQNLNNGTQFFSYTDKSKLTLNALGGDIHLNSDTKVISTILSIDENLSSLERWLPHVYPASLEATTFNGSAILDSDIILYPSASANVNVLAKQGIKSNTNLDLGTGIYSLTMSDANTDLLANAFNTVGGKQDATYSMFNTEIIDSNGPQSPYMHGTEPLHKDNTSARFVTQLGDISSVAINMSKQTIVQSGKDLVNSPILIQQNNATDASIISADRDIKFVTDLDSNGSPTLANNSYQIQVAGPGNALVKTGRNLDLGDSVGMTTVGNFFNPALVATGANLDLLVGLNGGTPNYVAFINKYVLANPLYAKENTKLTTLITPYMQQISGNRNLSNAEALAEFLTLKPIQTLAIQPQLNAILTPVFFNELKLAGTASAADKTKGNAGGFTAIETLFPGNKWQGELMIPFSKIQTISGGDINLFVPGGQVNAGLAVAPTGVKTPDKLGIVAQTQGSINAYVKNDFTVNTSRVFTLGGGDIVIWSSEGNIDAGKGAKSALAVTVNAPYFDKITNQLVIPAPTITSGSGIRAASAPGQKAGNVSLFAPKGIVNAGEAGIGGNNVTISATAVMGGNNIQVGGTSTGVPQASSGGMAAGLTGASNLTANVSQVGQALSGVDDKESQSAKNNTLSILSIDILGFGD
ncbi:MAG: hypothetical protein RLZZ66_1513 [Pseudomonadota bacterium]